jgi:two-component system LytT family response regulator
MNTQRERKPLSGNVRLLIVDDEPLAREGLRRIAGDHSGIEVVGECSNGVEALGAIEELRPDAMFLDIEMPELDGLRLVERVRPDLMPYVVFVTAYDRYALEAFRAHAIDYILKPLDRERMHEVFRRITEEVRRKTVDDLNLRLNAMLNHLERKTTAPKSGSLERVAVKIGDKIVIVETNTIDWIEASGNYVILHVGTAKYLLKSTLNHLGSMLDGNVFLQVHRSTIINTKSVREFRCFLKGSYAILMKDNSKIFSSRRFHRRIEEFLRLSV